VRLSHRELPARHEDGRHHLPPGGYIGGGMQRLVDIGIGPAGDVWVTDSWQCHPAALDGVDEALSIPA